MNKFFLLMVLFVFISCNGDGAGSSSSASNSSGSGGPNLPSESSNEVVYQQQAVQHIKESNESIPDQLRVEEADIQSWKEEGLIDEGEATELKGSI